MASRAFSRSKISILASGLFRAIYRTPIKDSPLPLKSKVSAFETDPWRPVCGFREYHDGRPRGPLWRGKKLIGKEALFVILGLKRFKDDEEKLQKFIKTHVLRLLKMDMFAVLIELERQEEVALAIKIFNVIRKQDWYKPDVYLYKDLIIALARCKKMDDVMGLWESMRADKLFLDSQTYAEVIRGFLSSGSPGDAMNIYEDMKKSPDPPEELPFRILLKGLLPHPLLRNRVKQDFEELFPEKHMYDPPEEIFGAR
ncbi:protein THYLAKOID ASSEMBLY 8-like, chloroplastic [Morus notabilis]|uniref:protein THYLAKOID ASSEMBLY 8-like, chloroplastic n=1 Tax=Morus notabilis TaxID=981085 RepID=UPI000CED610E|nr:protein THYLAKOID ASSEMBLY 8-like, chloroplastic [Morus notabilis]